MGGGSGILTNQSFSTDYPDSREMLSWEQWDPTGTWGHALVGAWSFDPWHPDPPWAHNSSAGSVALSVSSPHFAALAFERGNPPSVFFTRSGDYWGFQGAYTNWTTPILVAGASGPTGPEPAGVPHVAIDTMARVHLVYLRSDVTGRRDVYYLRNDDRGRDDGWTSEPGRLLSRTTADNHDAVIATSPEGQTVVIVWTATLAGGEEDLMFAYSLDGGVTWGQTVNLAATAYHEGYPAIAVDPVAGSFHVAYWRDDSAPSHRNNVLYTQAARGDPANWTAPLSVVDTGSIVSDTYRRPAITSYWRGGTNHIVSVAWTDLRNVDEDIYMTDLDFLECAANASPTSGLAPLTVSFDAIAGGGTPPYNYLWSYGDGGGDPGAGVVHTYASPGTYDASVAVTDGAGGTCFAGVVIDVLSPLPDLAVFRSEIVLSAPPYVAGSPLAVHAVAHNLGGSTATNATIRLALGDPTGPSLGDQVLPPLPSLGNALVTFAWTPPSAGAYVVCVVADPDNTIPESNEGNNAGCTSLDVLGGPDLAILAGDVTASPAAVSLGGVVEVNATVRNLGSSPAAGVLVTFFRDANGNRVPDAGESFANRTIPSLLEGTTTSPSSTWTASALGPQTLCAYADPNGTIAEGDETNNVGCASVTVLGPPDYVPWDSLPTSPITIGLARPVSLSVEVRNGGNSPANVTTRLALFNASTPSSPFASFDIPPLGAGEATGPFNASWTSPGVPGVYAVTALVDAGNTVAEGNESNNAHTWSVRVVPGPVTTIVVGSPSYTAGATYVTSATPLTFSVLDQSGTGIRNTTYRVDGGPWVNYTATGSFTLAGDGPHSVEWFSEDFAGNVEPVANAGSRVDNTPPATVLTVGAPKYVGTDTFVTSSSTLTLAATDGGVTPVGVAFTEYRIDGGAWTPYGSPFSLAGEGRHTVDYRSADLLGNVEAPRALALVVDDTTPTTALTIGEPKSLVGGTFVNASTPLTLGASDGGVIPVGLASTSFHVWSGTWSAWAPYTSPFSLTGADGARYVEYRSADRLGNQETVRNETLVLDDTPPTTTLSPASGPYSASTTFTLFATDMGSGVNRTEVRIDAGGWTPYAGGFRLAAGDHTVSYRSVDRLGNREPEPTRAIRIEGPPPPAAANLKPLVAAAFAAILALVGAWSAWRTPWPRGTRRRLRAFILYALPFVAAEAATGVVSLVTGLLAIPPLLGAGTAVDLAILVAGIVVSVQRVRKWKPPT